MCYSSCPQRFYGDFQTLSCKSCLYDCLTCNSSGHCLSCDDSNDFRIIDNQTFRCTPLNGYYDNGTTVALQCSQGCAICQNSTFCSGCQSGNFLRSENLCHSTCLPRFFPNSSSLICESCPFDCYTCDNTGNCLTCSAQLDFRVLNTSTSRCNPQAGYYESNVSQSGRCPEGC